MSVKREEGMINAKQGATQDGRILKIMPHLMSALMMIVALGLVASSGWAGEKGGRYGHDPKTKLEKLTKKLSLTDEQQAKILPILEEKVQKMRALREQMKEIRQQTVGRIETELTPEQVETFRKLREERHKKMEEYRGKHGKGHKKGKHEKEDDDD
jgi:Spy/CpxP family protein refolding chaperone